MHFSLLWAAHVRVDAAHQLRALRERRLVVHAVVPLVQQRERRRHERREALELKHKHVDGDVRRAQLLAHEVALARNQLRCKLRRLLAAAAADGPWLLFRIMRVRDVAEDTRCA